VLFVGNSYTHYNDMPAMVERLAGSVDRKIDAAMRAPGGWWWRAYSASSVTTDASPTVTGTMSCC
jgi:hypothetical protein